MTDKTAEAEVQSPPPSGGDEVAITLVLTASQWCEVVNAVGMRADDLESSHLDDYADMTEDKLELWINELRTAQDHIAGCLDKKRVVY